MDICFDSQQPRSRTRPRVWQFLVLALVLSWPGQGDAAASSPIQVRRPAPALGPARHATGTLSATQWTTDQGLPTNVLRDLVQTPDGFLWIGTLSGLVRFDGVEFRTFDASNTPELPTSWITRLLVDSKGRLWIVTFHAGAVLYEAGRFSRLPEDLIVADIAEGTRGDVWIASNQGLHRFQDGHLKTLVTATGLSELVIDSRGRPWALAGGNRHGPARLMLLADGPGRGAIPLPGRGMLHAWGDGGVLVAGADSVTFATDEEVRTLSFEQASSSALDREVEVSSIYPRGGVHRDRAGWNWIYSDKGLVRTAHAPFDPRGAQGSVERILTEEIADEVYALVEGDHGDLWVASGSAGLFRLAPAVSQPLSPTDGWAERTEIRKLNDSPWLLYATGGRRVLRNVSGSVVARFGSFEPEGIGGRPGSPRGAIVTDVGRIYRYGDSRLTPVPMPPTGTGVILGGVQEGMSGEFWFADGKTLYQWAQGRRDTLPGDRVIGQTGDGALWIGRENELIRIRDGDRRSFGPSDGLPPGHIRDIWQAPSGRTWLAIHAFGLVCLDLDEDRFLVATVENGLPDNTAGGMLPDEHGRLWINGNKGIFVVTFEALDRFARGETDQIPCRIVTRIESGSEWCTKGDEGALYFDTLDGLVRVDPDALGTTPAPPLAQVDNARVRDRTIDALAPLELQLGERDFSIRYTAPTLYEPEQVQFRYRLGSTSPWVHAGLRREGFFTNVPPGRHRFEVVAGNASGAWHTHGGTLLVHVPAYFNETAWFWALVIAIATGLLLSLYRYRTGLLHANLEVVSRSESALRNLSQKLMSAQEEERTRIARELHDGVSQRLALLNLELGMLGSRVQSDVAPLTEMTEGIAEDLHRLSHALHPAKLEQLGTVRALSALCRETTASSELDVAFHGEQITQEIPAAVGLCVYRIAQESLQNVLKHSGATDAIVSLEVAGHELHMTVSDPGTGFDAASAGTAGLGLTSMAERARAVGGRVSIDSSPGGGTRVHLSVPLAST